MSIRQLRVVYKESPTEENKIKLMDEIDCRMNALEKKVEKLMTKYSYVKRDSLEEDDLKDEITILENAWNSYRNESNNLCENQPVIETLMSWD